MTLDIGNLDTVAACDKGAEIELIHPTTQKPLGIFFNILGKDSQIFRDYVKEEANKSIRKEAMATKRGKNIDPITAEEAEQKAIELLTICTLGWRSETGKTKSEPHILINGTPFTFSVPNCKEIYSKFLWIRRQVDDAIGDLENFMKS